MVSVSMDGPNVNWRFFEMLQQEHAEHFGDAQLAVVGSCGRILSIMLSNVDSPTGIWRSS